MNYSFHKLKQGSFIDSKPSKLRLAIFALIFAGIGCYFVFLSHAAPLVGDINSDGVVNTFDLSLLLSSYGQSRTTCATATSDTCDLNNDSNINIFDLSILLSNWGKTASPAGPVISLNTSTNTISWPAIAGATGYQGATSNGPRTDTGRTTTYTNLGNVTSWSPPGDCGKTDYYGVNDNADGQWSAIEVAITWPACSSSKLTVSMNSVDGFGAAIQGTLPTSCNGASPCYVATMFKNIGVSWSRFDIGEGSNLNLVSQPFASPHTLPIYTQGSDGNCNGLSASQVTSDMNSILPTLKSDGIHVLEFCNESYLSISAAQYAVLYDAAHKAVVSFSAANNWPITLIAVATTDYFEHQRCGCSNSWYQDLKTALPGSAAEVDAFSLHPYPFHPATDGSNINAGGQPGSGYWWGMIPQMHTEAINNGFNAALPWYLTEAGLCASAGADGNCQSPWFVGDSIKGQYIQYMLSDLVTNDPWVVYFNYYSIFDDSSGGWGIINEDSASPFKISQRSSFGALQTWMQQHASQVND